MITNQTEQNPIQTSIITQPQLRNQNHPKAKTPEQQKRHQRIPSQTMQLSKNIALN
jgi:hypothetical protein